MTVGKVVSNDLPCFYSLYEFCIKQINSDPPGNF